ncbi:MAG: hypothetical protein WCG31_10045 [Deltaproteobacteria bacterium]
MSIREFHAIFNIYYDTVINKASSRMPYTRTSPRHVGEPEDQLLLQERAAVTRCRL